MKQPRPQKDLTVKALRSRQGDTLVYSLFLPGNEILKIADIERLSREDAQPLQGFQRKEIRDHANESASYLDRVGAEILVERRVEKVAEKRRWDWGSRLHGEGVMRLGRRGCSRRASSAQSRRGQPGRVRDRQAAACLRARRTVAARCQERRAGLLCARSIRRGDRRPGGQGCGIRAR